MLGHFARANQIYHRFKPFSDREAWPLFKVAALAEAVGWTLLIIGIVCKQLPVSWHEIPVAIAGRIHGMLFMVYVMAALAFGSSLGWSISKTLLAGLLSAPPYGSLVFEQWEARRRAAHQARNLYRSTRYQQLLDSKLTI